MANAFNICQICDQYAVKYCCPKCNIKYCSLMCYKSPNHQLCSEAFYQEWVQLELQQQKEIKKGKHTIIDILNREKQSNNLEDNMNLSEILDGLDENENIFTDEEDLDSDDENPEIDLSERLKGIDLNDANSVWEKLTNNEKKKFELLLSNNELDSIVEVYKPWWEYKHKILIEELDSNDYQIDENVPKIEQQIPEFKVLSTKPPSDCIKFNLLNVIAAYSSMVRYYNGEHQSSALESFTYFLCICDNFKSNSNFKSKYEAIESVFLNCQLDDFEFNDSLKNLLFQDTDSIAQGPAQNSKTVMYMLAALSDLYELVKSFLKLDTSKMKLDGSFNKKFDDSEGIEAQQITKTKNRNMLKKIDYYLSFTKTFLR